MTQVLFINTDLQVLFDNTHRNIEDDIRKLRDEEVLAKSAEALTLELAEKNKIDVPVIDESRIERTFHESLVPEYPAPNPNYDRQPGVPGRVHTLHVPLFDMPKPMHQGKTSG